MSAFLIFISLWLMLFTVTIKILNNEGQRLANSSWEHLILLQILSLTYRKVKFFNNLQLLVLRSNIGAFWPICAYSKLCVTDFQCSEKHLYKSYCYLKESGNENLQNTNCPGCKLFNTAAHFHRVFGKVNYPVYKVKSCKCNWEENPRILIYFTGASKGWREWWGCDRCWL